MLLPLEIMWHRVDLARSDSDTTFFLHLLYLGEMLSKLVTAGFVAAISDDREMHRYRLVHKLVRLGSRERAAVVRARIGSRTGLQLRSVGGRHVVE
jgi:hypothetical protein